MPGEQERGLPPHQQLAGPGKWPLVGERAPRAGSEPWTVAIEGLTARRCVWTLAELQALPMVDRVIDVHCVTRWSMPGTRFGGVPLATLLEAAGPLPSARFISFVARSERNHSTSLPLQTALELNALIALTWQGEPIAVSHGGPLRVVVPGRYFYKSLKWLERIDLLAEDRLGYWEGEAGYHNMADPWKEQRYIASGWGAREARELLAGRDISGKSLLGLSAAQLDLTGLKASGAVLRNADFRGARLKEACFDGANLSNAHLESADLRRASFRCQEGRPADLEGANFHGADLRGADLAEASLFGATFYEAGESSVPGARLDATTRVGASGLEQLTPAQRQYVEEGLKAPADPSSP